MKFGRKKKPADLDRVDEELVEAALGWKAIEAAMASLYGDMEPRHVGYSLPAALSDNLQGCSAYRADGHWHYVTFGLSELYHPRPTDDPQWSGWGFELTMRVPPNPDGDVPTWPFTALNLIAKYVNGEKVLLEPGHRINIGSAITGHPTREAPPTGLTATALTMDPQLGEISTPFGRVRFLQVVGITQEEQERMAATSTAEVLAELAVNNPLLVTDPARA